jgi:NO-binding membrane sensor protein with MHYT domain
MAQVGARILGSRPTPRQAIDDHMIGKSYNLGLVVLSVVVATVGSYVAVEIAQRSRAAQGARRFLWIGAGAIAMGLAIWSMHFVGMLATGTRFFSP